jgi:antibiotic biosynthesis monooxygenase (ABM) superfamily enzyme
MVSAHTAGIVVPPRDHETPTSAGEPTMTNPRAAATPPVGARPNVSLIIEHTVRRDAVERYESWLHAIMAKAGEYPGHQGVHIIRPTAGTSSYTAVLRFATVDDASRWTSSADRRALAAEIADALETAERLDIKPGLDFWFTPPAGVPRKARPWKQWLVTTSLIWPLTMAVPAMLSPVFQAVPALGTFGVSHLIVAATIVALVTWILMPPYVRCVSSWLFT